MVRALSLAGLFLLAPAALAGDGIEPSWATWKLDVTGQDGRLNAVYTITVGGDEANGTPVPLLESARTLDCRPVGRARVVGDVLELDGGTFECRFPDLIREANALIRENWSRDLELVSVGECDCAPMDFAYAEAVLDPKTVGFASVFHHPSVRLGVEQWDDEVESRFHFGGRTGIGKSMPFKGDTVVESAYTCEEPGRDCQFEHTVDGFDAGQNIPSPYVPEMVTGDVIVTIGGDRRTSYRGTIQRLFVDPGCRVH